MILKSKRIKSITKSREWRMMLSKNQLNTNAWTNKILIWPLNLREKTRKANTKLTNSLRKSIASPKSMKNLPKMKLSMKRNLKQNLKQKNNWELNLNSYKLKSRKYLFLLHLKIIYFIRLLSTIFTHTLTKK